MTEIDNVRRVGMHLLFYGREQIKVLGTQRVGHLLQEQTIKVV